MISITSARKKKNPVLDSRPGQTDAGQPDQQPNQAVSAAGEDDESAASDEALTNGDVLRGHASNTDNDAHTEFTSDVKSGCGDQQSKPVRRRMLSPYNRSTTLGELERSPSAEGSDGDYLHLNLLRKLHRNSTFHDLTETERQKLGGAEYRAIRLLAIVVPIYFFVWQLLGGLGVGAYVANNKAQDAESNGLNPWFVITLGACYLNIFNACVSVMVSNCDLFYIRWTGFFFAVSAFNNSGMSILDANMVGGSFTTPGDPVCLIVRQGPLSNVHLHAHYNGIVDPGW